MSEYVRARAQLVEDLRKYLLGPAEGEHELIPERATDRYHVGILAPSGTAVAKDEDDVTESTDTSGPDRSTGDGVLVLANATQQSAMGMTVQVPLDTEVVVDAFWAEYSAEQRLRPQNAATSPDEEARTERSTPDNATAADADPAKVSYVWRRNPRAFQRLVVPQPNTSSGNRVVLASEDDLEVEATQRVIGALRVVTISFVNRRKRRDRKERAAKGAPPEDRNAYQVSLRARAADGGRVFLARASSELVSDPEFLVHELLFRKVRQFAVGHGVAVDWSLSEERAPCASEVRTDWLPMTEVFKASAVVPELNGVPALDLAFLGAAERQEIVAELQKIPKAYRMWIEKIQEAFEKDASAMPAKVAERFREVARRNISDCKSVATRLEEGIQLLSSDSGVCRAFALANRAMAESMRRTRPNDAPTWRAFQIAFLLLALPSTAMGHHPARKVLDLIWFPTGGGKTEAYLGLVAFTLFFRRLSAGNPSEGAGTAVITRYTLRLLTMQQFERAARAVMACELLRRDREEELGSSQFSIGLFVGNSVTPKLLDEARKVIEGTSEDKSLTTMPVSSCPWCGAALDSSKDQRVEVQRRRVTTKCPNGSCQFHQGIPIACVDEELFSAPPSMIIGTVDKFAMMAWEPKIASLFGRTHGHKPPSLIIQDELHLIGDALGSMTGLYETAIDLLCADGEIPPKIVGSTATIRRASEQTHSVFLREVCQFPPNGLLHDDSFFYREDRSQSGRAYVGVHAQGRSPKHSLARVLGVLAQGAMTIPDERVQDQYWTMVTYFNSLRELGGAWVLGLDDVPKYIRAMPAKSGRDRTLGEPTELTSHLPSTQIPKVLRNIAVSKGDEDEDREPIGLLLCTNMISVGVDIDRLGLMIVNGQPKTTSEYIQASSRVGRPGYAAGLVVTLYNWTRPRDRSHYERFRAYHQSFYRNVESTSVTPFSMRARDRALHGVLVSLTRLMLSRLSESPSAIEEPLVLQEVGRIVDAIVYRAAQVSGSVTVADEVRAELDSLVEEIRSVARLDGSWERKGRGSAGSVYFMRRPNSTFGLGAGIETPQSMRDVDPPCRIELTNIQRPE